MVGWLIVLGLLALLLGLLLSPFSFAWDYDAPKDRFFWKLSWLGISFADSAGKGLFQREKEESQKPEKEPEKQKKKKRKKPKKSRRPAKKKSPESSERPKSKSWNTAGLSSRAACPCFRNRCGCCGKASL